MRYAKRTVTAPRRPRSLYCCAAVAGSVLNAKPAAFFGSFVEPREMFASNAIIQALATRCAVEQEPPSTVSEKTPKSFGPPGMNG